MADHKVEFNENEKRDRYLDFSRELKNLCSMKETVIPTVTGRLRKLPKDW